MPSSKFWIAAAVALLIGATTLMPAAVYSSWWWMALWTLIACCLIWRMAATRMWRRPTVFATHLSLFLVIAGGTATSLTSDRGVISLAPSVPENVFLRSDGSLGHLPRPIVLQKFTTDYYPGMDVPRDFHSRVTAGNDTVDISMNRIGRLDGWRLYQTSFDGRGGSTLTVTRDPIGIAITYTGFLLFALSALLSLFKSHPSHKLHQSHKLHSSHPPYLAALSLVVALIGTVVFVRSGLAKGYVPVANAGQVMLFAGIILAGASGFVSRRHPLIGAMGLLMAALAFLLSWLSSKDAVSGPLPPILASPWLLVHVALVIVSYALLALTLPIALTALTDRTDPQRLMRLSLRLMLPGVYLLGLGIIAGAMWANVSWGRYWAWDPKETWALVTMLLYAIPLHPATGLTRNPRMFHIYVAVAFLSIVMTYEGVNHLSSLHAYQ